MRFEETPLLRRVLERLTELLPPNWDVTSVGTEGPGGGGVDHGYDADLVIRTPGGNTTVFVVEVKTGQGTAHSIVEQLRRAARDRPAVVVTDFANPALRRSCEAAGIGYLDETGWVYLREDQAGLFVRNQGADRAPWNPRSTTMERLDGPGASKVIRALWDVEFPVGVRDLAIRAGVSPGTVAKVLPALARHGAVERAASGAVAELSRRLLLERWTQDYEFLSTNTEVHWRLAARGPDSAFQQLQEMHGPLGASSVPMALTGYLGALLNLPKGTYPVIPHTLLAIYTPDPGSLAASLGLRPATSTTANVVIVRPRDQSFLLPYPGAAPLPQVLADLMTMGGRFPELAEQLLGVAQVPGPATP